MLLLLLSFIVSLLVFEDEKRRTFTSPFNRLNEFLNSFTFLLIRKKVCFIKDKRFQNLLKTI